MSGAGGLADRVREEVGALTREPVEGYTAARDGRVKELRAAGERELAAALGRRRRPTLPAWAVDQLAHGHGDDLEALFAAADEVRAAHAGEGPVREATRAFTAVVRSLRQRAADVLAAAGATADPHLDEGEATLLAAAVDGEVARDLRAGALTRPVSSPGFAALASLTRDVAAGVAATGEVAEGGPSADGEDADAATRREDERRRDELADRHARLASAIEEAAREADGAAEDRDRLRRQLAEGEHRARRASERRDRLHEELARVADELAAVDARLGRS